MAHFVIKITPLDSLPDGPPLVTCIHLMHLQIQPLDGTAVLLCLHNPFSGSTEIVHLHPHPALSQRHQTRLGTDGSNVGSGKVVLLVHELIEIDIVTKGHLRSVQGKDLLLGVFWIAVSQISYWRQYEEYLRSGLSKRIFRSIRPGRINAGSKVSILFVAITTFTSPRSSNPSSWLRSSSIVR